MRWTLRPLLRRLPPPAARLPQFIDADDLTAADKTMRRTTHLTIKRVTDAIEKTQHFNVAVAAIMELVNALESYKKTEDLTRPAAKAVMDEGMRAMIKLLHPFAPHITSEMWERINK